MECKKSYIYYCIDNNKELRYDFKKCKDLEERKKMIKDAQIQSC